MKSDSELFLAYLSKSLPPDTRYPVVAKACRRVFCTLDGLPPDVASLKLTKHVIAESFANWTKQFSTANFAPPDIDLTMPVPTDKEHWLQVIATIFQRTEPEEF